MARVLNKPASNKWAVCYSEDHSVVHKTFVKPGQVCDTGQPYFEVFNTEEDANARCLELDPNWEDPNDGAI